MTDSTRDRADAESLDELREAVKRAEARIPAANEAIFAALRSARAQGMREAAEIADKMGTELVEKREDALAGSHDWNFYNGAVMGADTSRNAIRTRADAIERGEAA